MTRNEIETIAIGQTGLYEWNKSLPVCSLEPVREVIAGNSMGKVFRYVRVQGDNAQIGFIVREN